MRRGEEPLIGEPALHPVAALQRRGLPDEEGLAIHHHGLGLGCPQFLGTHKAARRRYR